MERSFVCSDGVKLAGKLWSNKNEADSSSDASTSKIICLHGWLDNCASFHLLAPSLVHDDDTNTEKQKRFSNTEVLALDFPGHGLSGHKSADGPTMLLAEYCFYVNEALEQMQWDEYTLVGHSMGAGVSVIMAAAWPEKVKSLVLLEGAGPLARNARDSAKHVRLSVEKRITSNKTLYGDDPISGMKRSGGRVYADVSRAVDARMQTARLSPGKQYISEEAARIMVERATIPAGTEGSSSVRFRHDPRLMWPSLQYNTQEQVQAFWDEISCPTLLVQAEDGWPMPASGVESLKNKFKLTEHVKLPGSHHHHADPNTASAVIEQVRNFLASRI
eukprot:CAMPEP_0196805430 /NCGR_PEP_ID=MMETSP1362-20130617/5182_1 /TAXON_ID=163516 /ORGANISM="Leptocylindrus danicus, Strain CCMP1856" /LENGTH=331 /DNA_ID=CAMNT_0042178333 /DNA_START=23 /DNA_END=1018 /DNA_ORIENTATION=+